MLVSALLVGAAFNSANPLGVRAASGASPTSSPAAASATGVKSIYENETVGLSLEPEGTSVAVAAIPAAPSAPAIIPNADSLSWPETKKLLGAGRIVLVDARAAVYFQTDHIPGAVSLPAEAPPSELLAFASKYSKNAAIVVYCGSAQCPLANQLVAELRDQLAFSNVREMPGGYAEYRQAEAQAGKRGTQ